MRAEATVADNNKTLLPVTIKPCRRPVIFELTQTADLTRWKGGRKDPAWQAFVADVCRFVGDDRHKQLSAEGGSGGAFWSVLATRRWPLIAGLAAIALVVAGAAWWDLAPGEPSEAPLRVAAFQAQNGSEAALFAQSLQQDVVGVMGEAGIPTTTDDPGNNAAAKAQAGMALNGSVIEQDGELKVFAQFQDIQSGVTLWNRQFEGAATRSDQLGRQIAVAAVEPLYELREVNLQKGLKVDAAELAKLMKIQQMIDNPRVADEGMLSQVYEAALAEAPDVAYAHGNLAVILVQDAARSPPDQRNALFARARSEANAAFKISPAASGGGYDALYLMSVYQQPGDLAAQESLLLNGIRNAPQFPYLSMRECQFLMSVGRNEDAEPYCQRAHAIRAVTAPIEWRVAQALKMRGEPGLAEQSIEQAVLDYPQNGNVRLAKFDILAFGNDPGRAAALLPAMLYQGEGFGGPEIDALKSFLIARTSGKPADADRAAAAVLRAATANKLRLDLAVKALTSLGKLDQAFGLLAQLGRPLPPQMDLAPANPGTSFLFAPETAPLRADPRFWQVASQQGLVTYWRTTGNWPDFCGKEQPLKQCQASAAKALGRL